MVFLVVYLYVMLSLVYERSVCVLASELYDMKYGALFAASVAPESKGQVGVPPFPSLTRYLARPAIKLEPFSALPCPLSPSTLDPSPAYR